MALSGLEGLLEIVVLRVTSDDGRYQESGLVQVRAAGGRELKTLGAATLKLRAPK